MLTAAKISKPTPYTLKRFTRVVPPDAVPMIASKHSWEMLSRARGTSADAQQLPPIVIRGSTVTIGRSSKDGEDVMSKATHERTRRWRYRRQMLEEAVRRGPASD